MSASQRSSMTGSMNSFEGLEDLGRDEALHDRLPAVRADHAFDHAGAEFGDLPRRHEKEREHLGTKIAVDMAHGPFVSEIGLIADASDDIPGPDVNGIVDKIHVLEGIDHAIGNRGGRLTDKFEAI